MWRLPAPVERCGGLTSALPIPLWTTPGSWLLESLAGGGVAGRQDPAGKLPVSGPLATAGLPSRSTQKVSRMEKAQGHRTGGRCVAEADWGPISPSASLPLYPLFLAGTPTLCPWVSIPGCLCHLSPTFSVSLCVSILPSCISCLSPDFLLLTHPFLSLPVTSPSF